MNSSQHILLISLILLVEAEIPSWPPGRMRIAKRFTVSNPFANAQWHLAGDLDEPQPIHPELRHFGVLGHTQSLLTEGPLGTFRFGKRGGRSSRETLSTVDQYI
ncbi:hypothetical protein GCK32_000145 [Trichostrongylus colubriformis]|uniref:Uncharacterized protein n=1 Tax=Trichostrongylus colubriformis TaxID=6319 RepID=A0AAN8J2G3_TRICO